MGVQVLPLISQILRFPFDSYFLTGLRLRFYPHLTFHQHSMSFHIFPLRYPLLRQQSFNLSITLSVQLFIPVTFRHDSIRFLRESYAHWRINLPYGISTKSYYKGVNRSLSDPIGVSSFRTLEIRLGWVPSLLRGLVSYIQDGRIPAFNNAHTAVYSHFRQPILTKLHRRFTCANPSNLSLALHPPYG